MSLPTENTSQRHALPQPQGWGKDVPASSYGPSTSTLHVRSLLTPRYANSPDATNLKGLFVDKQARFIIEKRQSKITTKLGVVVTYMIKPEAGGDTRKLTLKDMWGEIDYLASGTLVNIVEAVEDAENGFVVERLQGYLIVEPDRLISVTSIISQLYCERKAALSRFYLGGDSALVFRGVLAHELICRAMTKELKTSKDLKPEIIRICESTAMVERAYGIGMTDDELKQMQSNVVDWVARFMCERFLVSPEKPQPKDQTFTFKEVLGVEDNIWNPIFGMKGKIDATVLIEKDSKLFITPLEFKTGSVKSNARRVVSADHVGQVTLYTLMMSMRFGWVEEALLYYISDNSLSMHTPRSLELQQLVMYRNKFQRNTLISDGSFDNLPRPDGIDYEFKCTNCELKSVCTQQLIKQNVAENSPGKTEQMLLEANKLTAEELKFFDEWLKVINAETVEVEKKFTDKFLWTKTPEERVAAGTCITKLMLIKPHSPHVDRFGKLTYRVQFVCLQKDEPQPNFQVDDFVALSSNAEACINYGVVVMQRLRQITIALDQVLHPEYVDQDFVYSLDKINSTSPIAAQYGYLAKLMADSVEAKRLREYIIMKKQPKFKKLQYPTQELNAIMEGLNVEQKRVVSKATATDSFLFVKGVPGSGKTSTIVALLRALSLTRNTVLVATYTKASLDNILLRYKEHNQNFIKISSSSGPDILGLKRHTTKHASMQCMSIADLKRAYDTPLIVGTTLLSLKHPIFKVRRFDYCIIDEASQALPTAVFGALALCDKYIVFGDPRQLPPVLQSDIAKNMNICDNFFSLMATPASTISMKTQYRMNKNLMDLANALVYEGQMVCGSEKQEGTYLDIRESDLRNFMVLKIHDPITRKALCQVVSKKLEKSAVLYDTSDIEAFETRKDETVSNEREKDIVISCVRTFLGAKISPQNLGVIAPFRGQVNLIKQTLNEMGGIYSEVEVDTVDKYQGREMDIIICSFTRSTPPGNSDPAKDKLPDSEQTGSKKVSILEDMRRLNVAVTRAKRKLVLIGNCRTLEQYPPFVKLFDNLDDVQIWVLSTEELDGFVRMSNGVKKRKSFAD